MHLCTPFSLNLPPNETVNSKSRAERRQNKRGAKRGTVSGGDGPSKDELADYPRTYRLLLRQEAAIKLQKLQKQQELPAVTAKSPAKAATETTRQPKVSDTEPRPASLTDELTCRG